MGQGQSFEENLKDKTNTLNLQHAELDVIIKRINDEATRILNLILARQYNDRDSICQKIGYQKVDELAQFFPIETLEGVRYRLGVIPTSNANLENHKQRVCTDIVNFYLKKINLITNVQRELPNCRNMEQEIFNNLESKLQSGRLSNDDWLAVYEKLEKFNREIKKRYNLLERELERIRLAKNMSELDAIAKTTNTILSNTNNICRNYENELFQFSDRADRYKQREREDIARINRDLQGASPAVVRDDLKDLENQINREEEILRELRSSPISPRRSPSPIPLSPRTSSPIKETVRRVPMSPRLVPSPTVETTTVRRTISPPVSPVVERTVTRRTRPAVPRVHTVVEEFPVHRRVIRKPVVVSQEVVEDTPAEPPAIVVPSAPAPIKIEKKKLPEIPVEQFPETRKTQTVITHVAPPVVAAIPQPVVQPAVPVAPAVVPVVRSKQVTVRAEAIDRRGNTLYLRNPTKIEVTRTVPRDRVTVAPVISPRVVRAEPVFTKTIVRTPIVPPPVAPIAQTVTPPVAPVVQTVTQVPIREQGIPVRATREHIPRTPGEVPLREGQPVLYLGTGDNGWSRVRHTDGTEGYVPHTYLSK